MSENIERLDTDVSSDNDLSNIGKNKDAKIARVAVSIFLSLAGFITAGIATAVIGGLSVRGVINLSTFGKVCVFALGGSFTAILAIMFLIFGCYLMMGNFDNVEKKDAVERRDFEKDREDLPGERRVLGATNSMEEIMSEDVEKKLQEMEDLERRLKEDS